MLISERPTLQPHLRDREDVQCIGIWLLFDGLIFIVVPAKLCVVVFSTSVRCLVVETILWAPGMTISVILRVAMFAIHLFPSWRPHHLPKP